MAYNRIGYQLAIERVNVPPSHLHVLGIQLHELYLFLRLVDDLMDKELPLHIYQLSVRNPSNHLVHKYFLALLKNNIRPIFYPKTSFLHRLPKDIDNNSTTVFLSHYPLQDLPHLLHY